MNAFDIYITNAPDKGATTNFHIADNPLTGYFIQLILIDSNVAAQYEIRLQKFLVPRFKRI